MSRIEGIAARLRLLFSRRAAESRMDEEFRFHREMETEKYIRTGVSPEEARRRAAVAFGGVEHHKEEMRDGRGLSWLTGMSLDLKLGGRMLVKYPGLTLVGGFGMAVAVAIGAGTFAVYNSYLYPDLPLHEGDRVVALFNIHALTRDGDPRVMHDFVGWRRELRTVVELGAFRTVRRNLIGAAGQAEPISLAEMSASGFRVARVPPALGRTLLDEDQRPGAAPVVVIGHDVWQSRFDADPAIVGKTIRLGRTAHTIVGVMPAGFKFPVSHDYWVPLHEDPAGYKPLEGPEVNVFGRLASGATREEAQAELTVIGRRTSAENPATHGRLLPRVTRYADIFAQGEGQTWQATVLQLMIAMLLGVVCMNVAILVYARTVTRAGEIAMRTALGATRGRIVSQLFAEALVLSLFAALIGLSLVAFALRYFDHIVSLLSETGSVPFWIHPGLSAGTVLYALGLAALGAVIVGVLPALRATGAQLRKSLVHLSGGAKAQLGRTWTLLIVVQVAVAVAVLPPAILKGKQLVHVGTQRPGFEAHEVLASTYAIDREDDVVTDVDAAGSELDGAVAATQTALATRLRSEPGVVGVTYAANMPGSGGEARVEIDGTGTSAPVRTTRVSESYFGVFDVTLAAGRTFNSADLASPSNRSLVVNRTFVAKVLGGGDAIGRRVRYVRDSANADAWLTIVGVIEDFPTGVEQVDETNALMYHLSRPGEMRRGIALVHVRGQTPAAFAPTMRAVAAAVDPMLQLRKVRPLDTVYAESRRAMLMVALALALIVGSVLLLSTAGIYALMSFTVNQRRREIGVRAALGANPRRVLTGILSRAARQLALGVTLGLGLSVLVDRLTGGDAMGGNGLVLVPSVAAFMLVVGLLAAAGPARRGLRVSPTEALRAG